MGEYTQVEIVIELNNKATDKEIIDFKTEIREDKEIGSYFTFDKDYCLNLFVSSGRIQNLHYQLDKLRDIMQKHKKIIIEASGAIMIEAGDSFFFKGAENG